MKLSPQMEKKLYDMGEEYAVKEKIFDGVIGAEIDAYKAGATAVAEDALELVEALKTIKLAGHSDHARMRIVANEALEKWKQKWERK